MFNADMHERNVLGALINHWEEHNLNKDDFTDPVHHAVFRALEELRERSDMISVSNYLDERESVSDALSVVSDMCTQAPFELRKTEVDIIRGYAIRRKEYKRRMDEAKMLLDTGTPLESIPNCDLSGYTASEDDIQTFGSCKDEIMRLYDNGYDGCVPLDIPGLELRSSPGKLLGVLASPKSGKTTFLAWLILRSKIPFVVFSPENAPIAEYATIMFHMMTGKPFHRGPNERMSRDDVEKCIAILDKRVMFLNIAPKNRYIDTILQKAEVCVDKYGMQGVLINPWNRLIENESDRQLNKTDFIGRCLDAFEYFGQRKNVHTWYAMHPRKLQKDKDGNYPVPTFWDADGRAHHYNKISSGLILHRPGDDDLREQGIVDVFCPVVRWSVLGEDGQTTLEYNKYQATYSILEPDSGW